MKKIFFIILLSIASFQLSAQKNSPGIFDDQADVGYVPLKGNCTYNPSTHEYTIVGSGQNIWANHDNFHFVWKKMKGDFILRTNAAFIGKGVEEHRKWGWMIRTSLDSSSAHANAVVHGDGLTSLQFRKTTGDTTQEKRSTLTKADVVELERKGTTIIMRVARNGETFTSDSIDLDLGDEVYAGLFVCSHNASVSETVMFHNVRIVVPAPSTLVPYRQYLGSQLEILDVATGNSKIIFQSPRLQFCRPETTLQHEAAGARMLQTAPGRLRSFPEYQYWGVPVILHSYIGLWATPITTSSRAPAHYS